MAVRHILPHILKLYCNFIHTDVSILDLFAIVITPNSYYLIFIVR